jgi:hypothetical protein
MEMVLYFLWKVNNYFSLINGKEMMKVDPFPSVVSKEMDQSWDSTILRV